MSGASSIYSPVLESSGHPGSSNSPLHDQSDHHAQSVIPADDASVLRELPGTIGTPQPSSSSRKLFTKTLLLRIGIGFAAFLSAVVAIVVVLSAKKSSSSTTPSNGGSGGVTSSSPKREYVNAEQEADAVTFLPGWSPLPIPSQQFSGFVDANADGTLKMHYLFVECETNPADAPLVLWFNGGPGASSLYGMYVELGPFLLSDSSLEGAEYAATGVPQLLYNPYGWQKAANVLAFSMPPPIGYSYCLPKGPSATGNDCGPWNDTTTATATYHAITSWLERFPQYSKSKLWLSGESYAGVYVPEIAKLVLANQPENDIDFQGFLVGDACTPPAICGSDKVGPIWNLEFLYGKGAISNKLWAEIQVSCTKDELYHGVTHQGCSDSVNKVGSEAGGYWAYGFYDDCWYENDIRRQRDRRMLSLANGKPVSRTTPGYYEYYGPPLSNSGSRRAQQRRRDTSGKQEQSIGEVMMDTMGIPAGRVVDFPNGYQCGGPGAQVEWLSLPVVKKALNIPADAIFFQSDNVSRASTVCLSV